LMDIKRVAFEVRPVKSARPAVATSAAATSKAPPSSQRAAVSTAPAAKIGREEIAAIVDRFLAGRSEESNSPLPSPPPSESEAGSMYAGNKATSAAPEAAPPSKPASVPAAAPSPNGRKATDFVSEDDVRRALQKGEKIYISAKTIITPAARDMGEPAEVFAKVS